MAHPHTPGRPASRSIGWTVAALVAIVLLIWFFWGFRWPPTAAVVEDDTDAVPEVGWRWDAPPHAPPRTA